MTTLYFFNEPVKKLPATLKKKRKVAKGHHTTTSKHKQELYSAKKKKKHTNKHCLFMCLYFLYNNQIITSKTPHGTPQASFGGK